MNPHIKSLGIQLESGDSIRDWLAGQITSDRQYLLAFADDGIIWGRQMNKKLVISHEIDAKAAPDLVELTLQQAYVFGKADEIHLFRDERGWWTALHVMDSDDWFQESQILWGDRLGEKKNGFTRVKDETKGIADQIFPLEIDRLDEHSCVRLDLRHSVEFDEKTGEARVAYSRLVDLRVGLRAEGLK